MQPSLGPISAQAYMQPRDPRSRRPPLPGAHGSHSCRRRRPKEVPVANWLRVEEDRVLQGRRL